jgi:hypothetical protein
MNAIFYKEINLVMQKGLLSNDEHRFGYLPGKFTQSDTSSAGQNNSFHLQQTFVPAKEGFFPLIIAISY